MKNKLFNELKVNDNIYSNIKLLIKLSRKELFNVLLKLNNNINNLELYKIHFQLMLRKKLISITKDIHKKNVEELKQVNDKTNKNKVLQELEKIYKQNIKSILEKFKSTFTKILNTIDKDKKNKLTTTRFSSKEITKNYKDIILTFIIGLIDENNSYTKDMNDITNTIKSHIKESKLNSLKASDSIFFLCSRFSDSAEDHAPFQGKIYYTERYKEMTLTKEELIKIENIIKNKKLISLEDITSDGVTIIINGVERGVYLLTRPNCRHTITPITIDESTKNSDELLKDYQLDFGEYDKKLYDLSQKLRRIERYISEYKYKYEEIKSVYTHNLCFYNLNKMLSHYKMLIRKNELKANDIVRESGNVLKRRN